MTRGTIIAGKYRLSAPLGSGGMAEVWSATNSFTERQVAIKFLSQTVGKSPDVAKRFLNEAKVSARIAQRGGSATDGHHPNIIDVLDVGQTDDGQLFLVMELLTGVSLDVAMRQQTPPMTLRDLVLIMMDVAEALAAAHKSGIVHRDLKPTNIFLHRAKDGTITPKVLDFGVSKFLAGTDEETSNHSLTMAGTVLGSPLYMSPEQARGEIHIDGRTDIFAFGAMLFEAICGSRPFEARNFNALIVKIATTQPKNIDEHAPLHVPESLRRVVRECMQTDPELRAQSFEEVLLSMQEALIDLDTVSASHLATPLMAGVSPSSSRAPVMHVGPSVIVDESGQLPALTSRRPSTRPPPPPASSPSALLVHDTIPGVAPPYDYHASHGVASQSTPPPSLSPQGYTPNTSYASITVPPVANRTRRSPAMMLLAGATMLVIGGIALGAIVTRTRAPHAISAASPPPPAAVVLPATSQATAAIELDEPPTINVNALPAPTAISPAALPSARPAPKHR